MAHMHDPPERRGKGDGGGKGGGGGGRGGSGRGGGGRGGGGGKGFGGMTFTKVMPNFLGKYAEAPDEGIAGALKRHADAENREDRGDGEDEAPVMVDTLDALTSRQREKELKKPEHKSALFKGNDASAASKFQDSAFRRVAEQQQQKQQQEAAAAQAAADEAEAASGRHSFKGGVPSKRKTPSADDKGSSKEQTKKKKGGAALSFSMDDEDE
jgi:hypothetical protein